MFAFILRMLRRRLLLAALPTAIGLAGAGIRWLMSRRKRPADAIDPLSEARGTHTVSLHKTGDGERFDQALEALRTQLGARAVHEPDEQGFFEVELEADSFDAAVAKLRTAVAAAGADEAVELGEPSGVRR